MEFNIPLFAGAEYLDLAIEPPHTVKDVNSSLPSILILTPVKDIKRRTLKRYLKNLAAFDYPRHLLSIGILEGDSNDNSYRRLEREVPKLREIYKRVELFKYDLKPKGYHLESGSDLRHDLLFQKKRRSNLAKVRNYLLSKALRDEDWVLWVDADVCEPKNPIFDPYIFYAVHQFSNH
jgi:cellulose synthase/poly-beta-1,6-N-acetylglucosamine synthase-like glycosyltransferase